MKLKDLVSKYGEYEVIDETEFKTWNATLPEEKSASIQFESREGIQIRLEPSKLETVWKLENGDKYFYICDFGYIGTSSWYECEPDRHKREFGNVFLTKEDAEREAERRKVETLLLKHGGRRWFKKAPSENFYIWLRQGGGIVISDTNPVLGTIYFDSREQAEKAITEIGEQKIKETLFEVR